MARKIFACIALLFFLSSVFPTFEHRPPAYASDSRASLGDMDGNVAHAARPAIGVNRLLRAKSFNKAWVSLHSIVPDVQFHWSIVQTSFTRPLSKYDVYQQMNVFRL
jgi:hypothetical protein